MELEFPPALPEGGHIRVVSPAFPYLGAVPQRAERAQRALENLGYRVSYGGNSKKVNGDLLFAGTPQERAADIHEAFADPDVNVIMSAMGGYGCEQIVPLLDAGLIRDNPKPFIGYCGNVDINYFLAMHARLVSYYGHVFLTQYGEPGGPFRENIDALRAALTNIDELVCQPMPRRTKEWNNWLTPESEEKLRKAGLGTGWNWLRTGVAQGQFMGGEISKLLGFSERFGLNTQGVILHLELSSLNREPFVNQLSKLNARADLGSLAGLMIGCHCRLRPEVWADRVGKALSETLPDADYPVVVNVDIGYLDPTWLVPYGARARLDSSAGLVFPRSAGASFAHQGALAADAGSSAG